MPHSECHNPERVGHINLELDTVNDDVFAVL